MKKFGAKTSAEVLYESSEILDKEPDVDLAERSLIGSLKLLEGLYLQNPGDKKVLTLLVKSYAGYAYGFTENELLRHKNESPEYQTALLRAQRFYTRAKDYGLELLSKNNAFAKAKDLESYQNALQQFGKQDLEALFWTAFAWGNYLNYHKDSITALADIPRIEALMQRVMELDENYYYGGAHLFFGVMNSSRPKALGGNPEKALEHFNQARQISENKNLMVSVAEAQFYAVQIQDKKLFRQLLNEVNNQEADILPEQRLMNELAKIRSQLLLKKESTYFN
ncbi:MAG: hypothetical protein H7A32_03680 [Deltaproteobacteria bacterium]|nr:hypothetical protein [Deltaproteobacteria bacterium]